MLETFFVINKDLKLDSQFTNWKGIRLLKDTHSLKVHWDPYDFSWDFMKSDDYWVNKKIL